MPKAYLVALQPQGVYDWQVEESLGELTELIADAGYTVGEQFVQRREPDPATFIGRGKVDEIRQWLDEGDIVVFDNDLRPAQQGNLSEALDAPVLDRTQVILDIFARRAHTKEGKLQVELAQLNYLLPRLSGHGEAMSRLGGGIGTRGPGETKLEMDRRRIRRRIADLRRELAGVEKVRSTQRQSRRQNPLVALVGYTNAGKSTLMTALTGKQVYAADQLFATLDPAIRKWELQGQSWVYLSDTVGFVRNLPATLVAAFKATLEEVVQADLLLHVIDGSHPQMAEQKQAVEKVLDEIGARQDIITVYNKSDKAPGVGNDGVSISALLGHNLDALALTVHQYFAQGHKECSFYFPFADLGETGLLRNQGEILWERYEEQGVTIRARAPIALLGRLRKWQVFDD